MTRPTTVGDFRRSRLVVLRRNLATRESRVLRRERRARYPRKQASKPGPSPATRLASILAEKPALARVAALELRRRALALSAVAVAGFGGSGRLRFWNGRSGLATIMAGASEDGATTGSGGCGSGTGACGVTAGGWDGSVSAARGAALIPRAGRWAHPCPKTAAATRIPMSATETAPAVRPIQTPSRLFGGPKKETASSDVELAFFRYLDRLELQHRRRATSAVLGRESARARSSARLTSSFRTMAGAPVSFGTYFSPMPLGFDFGAGSITGAASSMGDGIGLVGSSQSRLSGALVGARPVAARVSEQRCRKGSALPRGFGGWTMGIVGGWTDVARTAARR